MNGKNVRHEIYSNRKKLKAIYLRFEWFDKKQNKCEKDFDNMLFFASACTLNLSNLQIANGIFFLHKLRRGNFFYRDGEGGWGHCDPSPPLNFEVCWRSKYEIVNAQREV